MCLVVVRLTDCHCPGMRLDYGCCGVSVIRRAEEGLSYRGSFVEHRSSGAGAAEQSGTSMMRRWPPTAPRDMPVVATSWVVEVGVSRTNSRWALEVTSSQRSEPGGRGWTAQSAA